VRAARSSRSSAALAAGGGRLRKLSRRSAPFSAIFVAAESRNVPSSCLGIAYDPPKQTEGFVRSRAPLRAALPENAARFSSLGAVREPSTLRSCHRLVELRRGRLALREPNRAAASLRWCLCGLAVRARCLNSSVVSSRRVALGRKSSRASREGAHQPMSTASPPTSVSALCYSTPSATPSLSPSPPSLGPAPASALAHAARRGSTYCAPPAPPLLP